MPCLIMWMIAASYRLSRLYRQRAGALAQFHERDAERHENGGGRDGIAQVIDVAERELNAEVGSVFEQAQVDDYLARAQSA